MKCKENDIISTKGNKETDGYLLQINGIYDHRYNPYYSTRVLNGGPPRYLFVYARHINKIHGNEPPVE